MDVQVNSAGALPPVPEHVPSELVIDFDIAGDPGLRTDIFARLAELRENAPPIAYSPYNGGHWMIFRNEDIQTVLTDGDRFSSSHFNGNSSETGGPGLIPLGMDPPHHLPYRTMLLRYLGPNHIRTLAGVIRAKAEELIRPLAGRSRCDFIEAVAEPMPISIFMEMMGLPIERFPEFRSLAVQIISPESHGQPEVMAAANARVTAILGELIAARTQEPKDDLVSALIRETVDGKPLGGAELMSVCYVLFLGGLDTVTNAMSFGIRYLAQDPVLQDKIRGNPDEIPALVERLLRRSAFVNPQRLVKADTELGGVAFKAGDIVWNLTWPGSNEPGGETEGPRHLAFGFGHHLCAGMHLARLELAIMYETWFRHIGRFSLAADKTPTMGGGPVMHIKQLHLDLAPLDG